MEILYRISNRDSHLYAFMYPKDMSNFRLSGICLENQVPSLPLTWHLIGGFHKRKLIFQVLSHRCYVSGREGTQRIYI